MALDDVEIWQNQTAFSIQVDGEQCYGEECSGCCGSATTFLTRDEMATLRDKIAGALGG